MNRRRTTGSFEVAEMIGSADALDRLFVYGTMRTGQTARTVIANAVVRCEPATMQGALYLFPMGFPGYVEGDDAGVVQGEVVWLTDLAATFAMLDAYEGDDFVRVIRKVQLQNEPGSVWAWVYILADDDAVRLAERIPGGDWVKHWKDV